MLQLVIDSDIEYTRLAVIGCGGSGKSYFSQKISAITGLPCYPLDMLYWKPNWVATPYDEFKQVVEDLTNRDMWIIDGNYGSTMEIRFKKAELVYFLDMPTELCLDSERRRRGTKRNDLPDYLVETEDAEFIEFITNFNKTHRNNIIDLIEKYPNVKVITFRSREALNSYLSYFENN